MSKPTLRQDQQGQATACPTQAPPATSPPNPAVRATHNSYVSYANVKHHPGLQLVELSAVEQRCTSREEVRRHEAYGHTTNRKIGWTGSSS